MKILAQKHIMKPSDRDKIINYTDAGFNFYSPMMQAAINGRLLVVKFLNENNLLKQEEISLAFIKSAQFGHLQTCRYLREESKWRTFPIDFADSLGETALHKAAFNGFVETCRYLTIECLADFEKRGRCGWTSLMYAAIGGNRATVEFFCNIGANVLAIDHCPSGDTVFHLAAYHGNAQVVEFLCKKYPEQINRENKFGMTAKLRAESQNHSDVLRVFEKIVKENPNPGVIERPPAVKFEDC